MLNCPVCNSARWTKRYRISDWDIQECDSCGFAKIDPMPASETRAECYSEEKVVKRNIKQKTLSHNLFGLMKRFFSRITGRNKGDIFYNKLRKHISDGSRILDIGCGDGSFLKLAKKDFACTGIEISEHLASLAKKDPEIKVITGNFVSADFSKEKYYGITMISLLEHLDDPAQALKICFELLNTGGVLLLKTVNYACLNRSIKKGRWTGFRPPDHMVYFSPANLRNILKKAGFRKIKIHSLPFSDNMYCEAWR